MAEPNVSAAQLALANKAVLEATGIYLVEPDGRVKWNPAAGRGQGFVPPWSWAGDIVPPEKRTGPDGRLTKEYLRLVTPGSDPSSAWRSMYESGGPFTKRSQWDSQNGTYEGGIDWATLLGTIGAGGIIGAGIAAAAGGGTAAIPTATAAPEVAAGSTLATTGPLVGTIGELAPGVAASGAVPAAVGTGATTAATGGGIASQVGRYAKLADEAGRLVNGATRSADNQQAYENEAGLSAAIANQRGQAAYDQGLVDRGQLDIGFNNSNIAGAKAEEDARQGRVRLQQTGDASFQNALQAIAQTEADQRKTSLQDVYRASVTANPSRSPYNPTAAPGISDAYRQTLQNLEGQGANRLASPAQYDTRNMPSPQLYIGQNLPGVQPYVPQQSTVPAPREYVPFNPNTQRGVGQQIGDWAGTGLGIAGMIARYYGR